MAAILMTSLLRPDAELRWANWLKLLQIPQSLILYRSPKIVTKFTRDHFFGPFDIDYYYLFVTTHYLLISSSSNRKSGGFSKVVVVEIVEE